MDCDNDGWDDVNITLLGNNDIPPEFELIVTFIDWDGKLDIVNIIPDAWNVFSVIILDDKSTVNILQHNVVAIKLPVLIILFKVTWLAEFVNDVAMQYIWYLVAGLNDDIVKIALVWIVGCFIFWLRIWFKDVKVYG